MVQIIVNIFSRPVISKLSKNAKLVRNGLMPVLTDFGA
jgi:hypothetical protein